MDSHRGSHIGGGGENWHRVNLFINRRTSFHGTARDPHPTRFILGSGIHEILLPFAASRPALGSPALVLNGPVGPFPGR
jgi:hypothetical protein